MKTLRLAAVALAAVALAACGTGTDRRTITSAVVSGAAGYFPESITVDKEDTVRIRVGNGTDRTHGFAIEGFKIKRTVDPNQTVDVRFKAYRGGTFRIYCQLHETHQPATLVVR